MTATHPNARASSPGSGPRFVSTQTATGTTATFAVELAPTHDMAGALAAGPTLGGNCRTRTAQVVGSGACTLEHLRYRHADSSHFGGHRPLATDRPISSEPLYRRVPHRTDQYSVAVPRHRALGPVHTQAGNRPESHRRRGTDQRTRLPQLKGWLPRTSVTLLTTDRWLRPARQASVATAVHEVDGALMGIRTRPNCSSPVQRGRASQSQRSTKASYRTRRPRTQP
jgi:hypothetical protein